MAQRELISDVCGNADSPSFSWLNKFRDRRAEVLEAIATALEARRGDILSVTSEETALTVDELVPEFARMVGTLRMFVAVVRDGSWVRAAIDPPAKDPRDSVGPNHDVRRLLVPSGVVAVFGASNFPLAYGVCGGDTASALAAGCPVVVKEHPAHPRTGRLIHEIAFDAICRSAGDGNSRDFPGFVLGYVPNEDPQDLALARELVENKFIQAVGFTGSKRAGMALEKLARERERPIPVFAEMGSCNPVYITKLSAQRRGRAIADELADSILVRHGQQCTKAGLLFVEDLNNSGAELKSQLIARFAATAGRDMLAPWVRDLYVARVSQCKAIRGVSVLAQGADKSGPRGAPAVLLGCGFHDWISNGYQALHEEIFGPATILIDVPEGQLGSYVSIQPSLVQSWYTEPEELRGPWRWFRNVAGRTVFNGVPTGVRVAEGMVHGGPFPATNRPDTTAVGPMAIERWCRPVCFQNCPQELLPPELRDPGSSASTGPA